MSQTRAKPQRRARTISVAWSCPRRTCPGRARAPLSGGPSVRTPSTAPESDGHPERIESRIGWLVRRIPSGPGVGSASCARVDDLLGAAHQPPDGQKVAPVTAVHAGGATTDAAVNVEGLEPAAHVQVNCLVRHGSQYVRRLRSGIMGGQAEGWALGAWRSKSCRPRRVSCPKRIPYGTAL